MARPSDTGHQPDPGAPGRPTVLVDHSYGGAVISEAGTHPAVAALVYIAAFAPDKGEPADTLIADPPPGAGTTDPAAPVRLPVPRPRQVPGLLRRKLTYEIATD